MLIQCTQKLQAQLKIKPETFEGNYEPLFSWHVNLVKIDRDVMVVL